MDISSIVCHFGHRMVTTDRHCYFAATTETNLALDRPAFMSSMRVNKKQAHRGNDGDYDTYFQTDKGITAWWAVDLAYDGKVTRVRIINRDDNSYSK